jgi:hypothetical protein
MNKKTPRYSILFYKSWVGIFDVGVLHGSLFYEASETREICALASPAYTAFIYVPATSTPSFPSKDVIPCEILFYVILGHRNMETPKKGHAITRFVLVASESSPATYGGRRGCIDRPTTSFPPSLHQLIQTR